ncbi:MAG: hypothetical protein CMK97_08635 [Pseudomonas sp.]|nr:hypothetical protein [Pseudomonas sp.]MBB51840.1 hypothetical protein [Pseudomonadales bacterium]MBB52331.1 hypothetical protein [Pseudomonadales bacterium]|tara:strand:- start:35263 stop:35802 length:540 start_codon:yes stop_codon:yes gene_type:complete
MNDQARRSRFLLAMEPSDGSSIGNQSLLEQLNAAFPDLSQDALVSRRDARIAQGVLQKGRGCGSSVKRGEADSGAVAAKPAVVNKPARSTENGAVSSIDALKGTLWATAATVEEENPLPGNILDKRYARTHLRDGKLGELADLVSTIDFGGDSGNVRDLLELQVQGIKTEGKESLDADN